MCTAFRERGERQRERETSLWERHPLAASYKRPNGETCNLGLCPAYGSNLQPLGVQDDGPPNWVNQPGLLLYFLKGLKKHCFIRPKSELVTGRECQGRLPTAASFKQQTPVLTEHISTSEINLLEPPWRSPSPQNHFSLWKAKKPRAYFHQMSHRPLERAEWGEKMEERNGTTTERMANRRLLDFPSKQDELNWGWRMTDSHARDRPACDWSCWQRVNGGWQRGSPWPGMATEGHRACQERACGLMKGSPCF